MRFPIALLLLGSASIVVGQSDSAPQPKLEDIAYWGSACPDGGLSMVVGPVNPTTNSALLTFTLSNFLPTLEGPFGSSLRMCNIVSHVTVEKGWKMKINSRGTTAQGNAVLPGNATMFFRSTYFFAEIAETQSIGMLDVPGPLSGPFAKLLTPSDGDAGIVAPCTGSELDIEFQARAVKDETLKALRRRASNETTWTLSTDVEILRC
ncbi:hypothetical protein BU24DRAFT_412141 [Aaosphaeria arxii CBS 175.79]|uniref:Secreted protein n=1 Tax=Aaosphaeria arxii CBS 175.79 TaxID=1450172 RepID=A0A6A5XIY4_9PLEO|nr:uncharacterized protein BU24DRAFT_412141 [Aaosphaeria arxii CBS 175.79]KAF2012819.1 hypothetical protein BU24DRAFT_412141 [Aaosphaeria arxii CBS 175.79]